MNKLRIIAILVLCSIQTGFSQTKEIKGDTVFRYQRNIELQKKLDLQDFEKSTDEFNFRFRNHKQIVEISKNDSEFSGTITNFTYYTKRVNGSERKLLSNKIILSAKQAENIYNIVQKSTILLLQSDKDIENWRQGMDGITYFIEHSDKQNYWLKYYWTPSSQKSIPEAILVLDLVKNFSDTLNLEEVYSSFINTLPKKGCYSSGASSICFVSNSFVLGYSGAAKLPLGFYSSYSATFLGKKTVNCGASLQYNFDNDGFHHLNLEIAKWKIFYKNSKFSDFVAYNYQNRILNFDDAKIEFENHQMKYGLILNNFTIGLGLDYLSRSHKKVGGHFYTYKWFSKPQISTTITTSILDNQLNYKAEIFKEFSFRNKFLIRSISIGLAYEDFMNYKDLYFSARLSL